MNMKLAAMEAHVSAGFGLDCADSQMLLDDRDILEEQFKVACERSEAWKALALATRKEYGVAAGLLGEASAYLGVVVTDDAVNLDARIMAHMDKANIMIPAILEGELS